MWDKTIKPMRDKEGLTMTKSELIHEIFDHTPDTYRNFSPLGEHMVVLNKLHNHVATLERLSKETLSYLAEQTVTAQRPVSA
jgi:hypothetical protein